MILERPKLKDYRLMIRESLCETLALDVEFVSVKFKTAERVGPVGEVILTKEVSVGSSTLGLRDGQGAPDWTNWGVEVDPSALR